MASETLGLQDTRRTHLARLPVVVGVDNSPESKLAVAWAAREADLRGVPLRVVRGFCWTTGSPYTASDDRYIVAELRTESERIVGAAAHEVHLQHPELDIQCEVAEVFPPDLLTEQSEYASLVVVGRHDRGAFGRLLAGSVSSSVAARAQSPVVVVSGSDPLPGETSQVVVGVKPDETARPVLAFAFAYAERHSLGVHAILSCRDATFVDARYTPDQSQRWLAEALAGYRDEYPGVPTTTALVREDAAPTLVVEAASSALLVVGRHGRTPRLGAFLGSVSQAVVRHATRPVAVVPVAASR